MMRRGAIAVLATAAVAGASAQPASAGVGSTVCGIAGLVSGLAGKACNAVTGPVGGLVKKVLGGGGSRATSAVARGVGLAALGAWVIGGARFALHETTTVLGETTSPQLTSTWFSSAYWRMTGIAALLTLPFLFAAAVQAMMRSDLAMLALASFGYLPLAMLGVVIAAPLTMLLLSASDEMASIVTAAAGGPSPSVLTRAREMEAVLIVFKGAPFVVFIVGLLTTAGALVLWLELVVREAAVYVIVLMLPLAFAAMVWPARRVWAIRAVELLLALVLSKFAIVAVLTLGSAALRQMGHLGIAAALGGVALLMLAAFAPWALLRLLPMAELASSAAGGLGRELRAIGNSRMGSLARAAVPAAAGAEGGPVDERVEHGAEWTEGVPARMREQAQEAARVNGDAGAPPDSAAAEAGAPLDTAAATVGPRPGTPPSPADAPTATRAERLPGLGPIWQAEDETHRPVTLGLDEWSPLPPPAWPPGPPEDDAQPAAENGHPLPDQPAAEDGNPLPERQPPGDDPR
jgi:hypothetical protein